MLNMDEISSFREIFAEFFEMFEKDYESILHHIIIEDKNDMKYHKKNILNTIKVNNIIDKYKYDESFNIEGKNFVKNDTKSFKIRIT